MKRTLFRLLLCGLANVGATIAACHRHARATAGDALASDSARLAATPQGAPPNGLPPATQAVAVDSCLPFSEFQLRGVALTSLSSMALEALGKAPRVTTDTGEDDGGRYEVQTFHYRDLEFDDVRGFVDRLVTNSSQVRTPSGLGPGPSYEAVRQLLLRQGVRVAVEADTIRIPICAAPNESEMAGPEGDMALVFDKTRHLSALVMRAARP